MSIEELSPPLQSVKEIIPAGGGGQQADGEEKSEIRALTQETSMMAVGHPTHSAVSGSATGIDSRKVSRNDPLEKRADIRTDPEFHPKNDILQQQHSAPDGYHVSNHIRTNSSAMPPPTCTEQILPLATTTPNNPSSDSERTTFTSNIDTPDHQGQDMCLSASNTHVPSKQQISKMGDDDISHTSSKTSGNRRKRDSSGKPGATNGRWTPAEHQAFLEGLKIFGREWKKVAERIPTRTSAQIRSHAQKYFAKISRDESITMQEQAVSNSQSYTASAPEISPSQVTSSVQRNVERILSNPVGLQQEVEDTLRELRERYHQLQIRLEETNRRRGGFPSGRPRVRHVDIEPRKRPLEEVDDLYHSQQQDDLSSVSSTVSGLTRELGDEELIALSVLGGTLPRSASSPDLQHGASQDDLESQSRAHHSSSPSTVASTREDMVDDEPHKKRKVVDDDTERNETGEKAEDGSSKDDMML